MEGRFLLFPVPPPPPGRGTGVDEEGVEGVASVIVGFVLLVEGPALFVPWAAWFLLIDINNSNCSSASPIV
jgi:hypothetical protein